MPHQINWIEAEEHIHAQGRQAFALAEKSVRIGWTYADAFKNVRKRLRFRNRDYLFASKDYPSAIEYMRLAYNFAEFFNYTRAVVSRGEEHIKVQRLDPSGYPTAFTDNLKIGVIKFDNGSRILAFSSHPQAMAVYGGDVGIDEFAKHPNAKLLWETAQGRVTWGGDLATWSAHDGEDTLFYQFAQQARSKLSSSFSSSSSSSSLSLTDPLTHSLSNSHSSPNSHLPSSSPWNLYYKVTMPDALDLGLLGVINRLRGTHLTKDQFLADCRARAGLDEIYEQSYLCNPVPGGAGITDWSAIERCRYDYQIRRLHLEHDHIQKKFGQFNPDLTRRREEKIRNLIRDHFSELFDQKSKYFLGFDVAASGKGDLAAIYIDEFKDPNHGFAPSSPAAPTTGTSSKPSSSVSWTVSVPSAPPAIPPASDASSAGKPLAVFPGRSPPLTSPPKNTTSASHS